MEVEREDKRVHVKSSSGRATYLRGARRAREDNVGGVASTSSAAAHERAVMNVRLTLLLLIIGVALFLFTGPGGVLPLGPEFGGAVELLK
jgi:hypothetical protein